MTWDGGLISEEQSQALVRHLILLLLLFDLPVRGILVDVSYGSKSA